MANTSPFPQPLAPVTVHLPPETERTLRSKASAAGVTLEAYLQGLAARDAVGGTPAQPPTFDHILAPVRAGAAAAGADEAELTALFEEARRQREAGVASPAGEGGRLPLRGRFADLGWSFPEEQLDQAQRELWATFPRDLPEPPESS